MVGGAETVDFVLTRAEAAGSAYTPAQVHAVLDAQMTYLEAIGAVGPAAGPQDPSAILTTARRARETRPRQGPRMWFHKRYQRKEVVQLSDSSFGTLEVAGR